MPAVAESCGSELISKTSGRPKPQPRYGYPMCWSVGKSSRECTDCHKLGGSVRCPPYDDSPLEY